MRKTSEKVHRRRGDNVQDRTAINTVYIVRLQVYTTDHGVRTINTTAVHIVRPVYKTGHGILDMQVYSSGMPLA